MAHEKNHDYHILQPSIQPLLGAIGAFIMLFGSVIYFHDGGPWMALIGLAIVIYVMVAWW
nr:cytochrome c oxidase subunit 3 [Candidatus Kutchimonas denitrificans]